MDVNDDAGSLTPRGVLKSIASRLAPTEKHSGVPPRSSPLISPSLHRQRRYRQDSLHSLAPL
ncbi:hypothetical protein EKG40_25330 [Pseudomonas moorei]|nr:hypothetical protein EKG40_25330 [Pseudomonas moorei]